MKNFKFIEIEKEKSTPLSFDGIDFVQKNSEAYQEKMRQEAYLDKLEDTLKLQLITNIMAGFMVLITYL